MRRVMWHVLVGDCGLSSEFSPAMWFQCVTVVAFDELDSDDLPGAIEFLHASNGFDDNMPLLCWLRLTLCSWLFVCANDGNSFVLNLLVFYFLEIRQYNDGCVLEGGRRELWWWW